MCFPLLPVSTRHHSIPDFFSAYILVTLLKIAPHKVSQNEISYLCSPSITRTSKHAICSGYTISLPKVWAIHLPATSLREPSQFQFSRQTFIHISNNHSSVLHQIVDTGAGQCRFLYRKLEKGYLILKFKLFLFMVVTGVLFFPVSQAIWTFHSDEHNIFFWQF